MRSGAGADMKIHLLNGPNLNLLGAREPEIYGAATLDQIRQASDAHAKKLGATLKFLQSNHEGALVDWVQAAASAADGLIINPGAYTHTSIALHDALKAAGIPKIELHLSNIHAREAFRRRSYVSPAVDAVICGLGPAGYLAALDALVRLIDKKPFP